MLRIRGIMLERMGSEEEGLRGGLAFGSRNTAALGCQEECMNQRQKCITLVGRKGTKCRMITSNLDGRRVYGCT